jgi:uncharacterized protein (TIGR03437 family)
VRSAASIIPAIFLIQALISADPPPSISVSGGIQIGGAVQPLLFTWNSSLPVQGSGWAAGETVSVALEGPLDSPGVQASQIVLGPVTADSGGNFSASLPIPYDGGVTGPQAAIPRPGSYSVRASAASGSATAVYPINLCPATYTGGGSGIDWSHERGSRDGVLPGPLSTYSPERADPNWVSVWDNRPVQIYGTVAAVNAGGADQPSRVSYEDDPITHYAHDVNVYLLPDQQYRWVIGTANYASNGEDEAGVALGRIEVEWESLNNGNTASYGAGQIGLPDWAIPTTGDRIYVLGRWVLDCGHPEVGDRTELHPPRLIAVMRQRLGVSSTGSEAAQVDVYVSGHGGGANQYPSGMDALLNQGGRGGGRIRDVLSASDQQTYYRPGPLALLEAPILDLLVNELTGQGVSLPIYPTAGPSAFSWGAPAPEQQPVNDMDYDFDVPLPIPPGAAGSVTVEAVSHPQHSTSVAEAVTYGSNGSQVVAHVHLPYKGADNGIYARTLKFSWNAPAPPHHFRLHLDRITPTAITGQWQVWADLAGQWTHIAMKTSQGQPVDTSTVVSDAYLRDGDTLRVLVQGYHAQCIDGLFGTLFNMSSYSAGIQLLESCGPVNNDDLGGALLEAPALPSSQGTYTVQADAEGQTGGGAFQAGITAEYASPVVVPAECQGRGALAPAISTGGITGAGLSQPPVTMVSPDGLISVFGANFTAAGVSRGLTSADIAGGQLPANLSCTCVEVNHRLAPLLYVSPTLINLQSPTDAGVVATSFQVIANCGASNEKAGAAAAAAAQPVAPEFFFFQQNTSGVNPIAAIDAVNGTLIGPGYTPARPGDYVALYATGLGATNPPLPPGTLAMGIAPTALPVTVTLNGAQLGPSDVLYAGAAPGFAGLYQINIRIPANAPSGNLPVSLSVDGVSTPAGGFLLVQH